MRKLFAALVPAAVVAGFITAGVATSAYAVEQEPEVCYADETHTELTYDLQRSDWVAAVPGQPAVWEAFGDFSQSSSDGSASWTPNGSDLDIATADTGHRKVAGYHATSFPLANAWDWNLDYTVTTGIEPGGNLLVDLDNDATPDGYLVIESIYGGVWWLSGNWTGTPPGTFSVRDGAPHAAGGGGYPNQGSFSEWITAYPNAQVLAVGFSLGSGVTASGTVHSLFVNGTTFNFSQLVSAEVPPVPEHYTDWYVVSSGQGLALPDGHSDGEEFQTDALYRYVITGDVEVTEQVEVECPPATEEPTETPTPTETPQATAPPATTTPTASVLAHTGANDTSLLQWVALFSIVAGVGILAAVGITKRARAKRQ